MNFSEARFLTSYGLSSQLPPSEYPEVAFAGRSNVGKSSAINRIFNRKGLARVSSVPGKTATINFYAAGEARFADLPGYGYAKVSKSEQLRWSELIEGYFAQERDLRLVVLLVDMRHPATADDRMMIDYLTESGIPFIIVLTKSDKLNKTERAARLSALEEEFAQYEGLTVLPFSAVNGENAEELRRLIASVTE